MHGWRAGAKLTSFPMALLVASGLTRRPWFEGRDFALDEGEVVVLAGATGSGKTLFLRALADLDPCDEGELTLAGERSTGMPACRWRRNVLYVHPSPPRFDGTVGRNLERVAELAGNGARPLVAPPGLALETPAATLSTGETQLLALYRALSVEPRVLLLDETLNGLDPDARTVAERLLGAWVAGGSRAVLLVSHDEAQAERLGARRERFP